jgi:hypothetical protein
MGSINHFFHWFSHLTNSYNGRVVTWSEDSYIYVAFKCDTCGKIDEKSIDKIPEEDVVGNLNKIDYVEENLTSM